MLVASWKGEISHNDLMWPFNFEGDMLHLNLLTKTQIFRGGSVFIHITYYGKVANYPKFVAHDQMVIEQKNSEVGQRPCSYIKLT